MPSFCEYGMCHNLGSSSYLGYCNEYHMNKAFEKEKLMKILESNPHLSTLKDARAFLIEASSRTLPKDSVPQIPPSKEPSSMPQNKQPSKPPTS